jgi:hypothetical protein
MTTNADGTNDCNRCGADVGNAGLDKVAVISVLVDPGDRVLTLHLCTFSGRLPTAREGTPDAEKCAQRVLTVKALAHYVSSIGVEGEGVQWYTSLVERMQQQVEEAKSEAARAQAASADGPRSDAETVAANLLNAAESAPAEGNGTPGVDVLAADAPAST